MPLKMFGSRSTVGLDLGHSAIRATQVERSGNSWRIVRHASIPTPPDSIKDGVVMDAEAVGHAIRQALREGHMSASAAHIAVSGGTVVVRVVHVPAMAEATLRKSIKYEAGRYVPSSAEDSYIEFEIVGKREDGQMDVLLAAAPKEIVAARMRACEEAGLDVDSVDVEPFAAYRSLLEFDSESELHQKAFALIDVGASNTRLSVIRNGVFLMTRSIPNGAAVLTEALKSYFKLSDEDAEAGKAQLDIRELLDDSKPRENPPLRVVQPHVDDLVREIRRSLNYFQSQLSEGQQQSVETLLLTGGGSKLQGLAEYVQHKLGLPTRAMGLFENPHVTYLGTDDPGEGLELAVSCGLAMRAHMKQEKAKAA
jgi:type IV pilus assembly protein PilM